MKAIVVRSFGAPERLALTTMPEPEPGYGEVGIEVAFAGVGYVDTLVRGGKFDFVPLPVIPGIEVSGHIRSVGPGVANLSVGQRVAALLTDFTGGGMGGYAEVAIAKAALTIPLAETADLANSAAAVVNGATAFMALDGVSDGHTVLVTGASGGLGRGLIAAARAKGASRVIAITSKKSLMEELKNLGATDVLAPDELPDGSDIDVAYDTVGGELRLSLIPLLRTEGRLMLLGNASGSDLPISGDEVWLRNITVSGLSTGGLSHLVPERVAAAATAALNMGADFSRHEILPLDKAAEAHRRLESGSGGKMILEL